MAAKLNQIIAIEKGIKGRAHSVVTDVYKLAQKPALFEGLSRTYNPKDDGGETFPAENKRVTMTWKDVSSTARLALAELFAVTARKDWTNTAAKADVTVDGEVIVQGAPVPYLLFLEKQLTDINSIVSALPTLDEAETWSYDATSGLSRSAPVQTHKTKKTQKPIVLYPATPEHPAQTQLLTEDEVVGYWTQVKTSGAIAKTDKAEILKRISKLSTAVKEARETANMQDEVQVPDVAANVLDYVFGRS